MMRKCHVLLLHAITLGAADSRNLFISCSFLKSCYQLQLLKTVRAAVRLLPLSPVI